MTPGPASLAAVVAHQGGWDEILLVVGPIAVVVGLLVVAKRRVERHPGGAGQSDESGARPSSK